MAMSDAEEIRKQDGAVLTCTVDDCSYNRVLECCAPTIQIGEDHPRCDTYTRLQMLDLQESAAVVGKCGVMDCGFNEGSRCAARGITVDHHSTHADCATFRP
jgi:hypothetical protein